MSSPVGVSAPARAMAHTGDAWRRRRRRRPRCATGLDLPLSLVLCLAMIIPQGLCHPYLLFANKKDIQMIEVRREDKKPTVVAKHLEDVAALDFLLVENIVCWTEIKDQVIRCLEINPGAKENGDKRTIVDTGLIKPEGLACDWVNRKLYWTDSGTKRIEVAAMDPVGQVGQVGQRRERKVLFWTELDLPRAIVVAPNEGLMFWTDWGVIPKIERASMDGDPASRVTLIDTQIEWPNGLTLDYDHKIIYWLESKHQQISSVDWDGKNRRVIMIDEQALPMPFAISFFERELYWTDWNTKSIHYSNTTRRSHPREVRTKHKGDFDPMDIKVFDPTRQKLSQSPCQDRNAGCSHLCLAASNPAGFSCACPIGLKAINNRTCAKQFDDVLMVAKRDDIYRISLDEPDYTDVVVQVFRDEDRDETGAIAVGLDPVSKRFVWTDYIGIHSANLDGSNSTDLISTEVDHPDGVAVDWLSRNLYWTDTGMDRIEVARLDGSSRHVLISRDLDEPRAIVLDPLRGWMFWSDWGQEPRIERAWMDGTHREVIVNDNLGWPNGIALDVQEQKLYWCDAKTDRIEVSNVDGSGRRSLIYEMLPHPFGLTVLGDYIYWTDWQENVVQRADKETGENRIILVAHLEDLMGVHAASTVPNQDWDNACSASQNNGGCSHLCLFTPEGKKCQCPSGSELMSDHRSCVVPEAFLLYTHKSVVGRLSLNPDNSNDYTLAIRGVAESSALDFDSRDGRIYWTDIQEKTISRAFLNGSNAETLVEFGVDFPDGMAVDWAAGNLYWTDMSLHRIEVSRCDGSARRVLIWKDLYFPANIAVNPKHGMMYWSSWEVGHPLMEQAAFDGSDRKVVYTQGRSNGLTVDYDEQRLYWSDLDNDVIMYASLLPSDGGVNRASVRQLLSSRQAYAMTMFKDQLYWVDWKSQSVERANKKDGSERVVVQRDVGQFMDILAYNESRQIGTNLCADGNNGGCSDLCLFVRGEVRCACPSHYAMSTEGCVPPTEFLLFSQKNKVSRLIYVDDTSEVPDSVLPIRGARDIGNMAYDPLNELIYWIDYGSRRKDHKNAKVSVKRAYTNGTQLERLLHENKHTPPFRPLDLAIDPISRLLFWTCNVTHSLNVTRLDDPDKKNVGAIVSGPDNRPTSVAVHPLKSIVFWVNAVPSFGRIQRSKFDGSDFQTIVSSDLNDITDLTIDMDSDRLYWTDADRKHIESCKFDGSDRRIVVSGLFEPVGVAVQGRYVYWADRGEDGGGSNNQTIRRANKQNGRDALVIKHGLSHLSDLLSVVPLADLSPLAAANPCLTLGCSHLCYVNASTGQAKCSCPLSSGLVLNADDVTCGLPPTCKPDEFTCESGPLSCIPLQWRCDGQSECHDHSDEMNCPECGPQQFRCRNGLCVNGTLVCDGVMHCTDKTDELSCCPRDQFRCAVSGECIDDTKTCDGISDCSDSSDELLPQCNSLLVIDHVSHNSKIHLAANGGKSAGSNAVIVLLSLLVGIFFVGLLLVVFFFSRRRKRAMAAAATHPHNRPAVSDGLGSNKSSAVVKLGGGGGQAGGVYLGGVSSVPVRGPAIGAEIAPANSNVIHPLGSTTIPPPLGVQPAGRNDGTVSRLGGSSNGMLYDRNHVTGASSSTSSNAIGPSASASQVGAGTRHRRDGALPSSTLPPRSRAMHDARGRMSLAHPRSQRLHYPNSVAPPTYVPYAPNPTPCSTDINYEESDGVVDYYVMNKGHDNSVANSTVGGYDSEYFGGGGDPRHLPVYNCQPTVALNDGPGTYLSDYDEYAGQDCVGAGPELAEATALEEDEDIMGTSNEMTLFLHQNWDPPPSPAPSPTPL